MQLSERLARIEREGSTDPRTQRDLEVIRNHMARVEGKLLRIAKKRSTWTKLGALSMFLELEEPNDS